MGQPREDDQRRRDRRPTLGIHGSASMARHPWLGIHGSADSSARATTPNESPKMPGKGFVPHGMLESPQRVDRTFSFDTGGGTQHATQALASIAVYSASGPTPI
ncbi:hypothetical protein OAF09_00285 [bacterium]|nr:hypothetical protein [bacterium]MDC0278681.1 hypothetical protein [bacterium]